METIEKTLCVVLNVYLSSTARGPDLMEESDRSQSGVKQHFSYEEGLIQTV